MTLTLFGLAIYLFCVHSFKLPIASVGIGIGLLGVLGNPRGISIPPPVQMMAAFILWAAITGLASQYRPTVMESLLDYSKALLIFFVVVNATRTLTQLTIFIGTWLMMFGLFPVRGTYFNFLAGINTAGRYGWNFSFNNYNDLAAYTILALAIASFLLVGRYPRWIRILALLGAGLLSLMVILTQSRGGLIALVIAFALLVTRSRNRVKLVRFAILAAFGIALAAPGSAWERFARMKYLMSTETLSDADTSAEQRYVLLQVGAAIARDHLATGVGLGAYSLAHGVYAEDRPEWQFGRGNRDTHNMYLNLVAETGVPGALLFIGMLVSTLHYATGTEKRLRASLPLEAEQLRILRFGLVAYLIAATFGTFHRISFLYMYLAVVWSAARIFDELLSAAQATGTGGRLQSPVAGLPMRGAPLPAARFSRIPRA